MSESTNNADVRAAKGPRGLIRRAASLRASISTGAAVLTLGAALAGCSSGGGSAGSASSGAIAPTDGASSAPSSTGASSGAASASPSQVVPELLSIPAIRLTTGIEPQGLKNGEVNPGAGEVIWFTGSARVAPGAKGTAVIAGHVADGAKPDVFARLGQLHQGGSFDVTMSNGATQKFSVVRAGVVDKQALRHDQTVWGANSSSTRVVLVTCDDELGFGTDGHRKANYVVVGEHR